MTATGAPAAVCGRCGSLIIPATPTVLAAHNAECDVLKSS